MPNLPTDCFLVFSYHFDRDAGLDYGRLVLNSFSKGSIDVWRATTSTTNKQKAEDFHDRGGPIPPNYRTTNAKSYRVDLNPIDLQSNPGIRGNFYRILPYLIRTDQGKERSDIGIHKDANSPGSLGCIVMSEDRFAKVEEYFRALKVQGLNEIPLFVSAS